MSNRKVALLIRIKFADGSRSYCKPVFSANGKLKPLFALVSGKPEYHSEGCYVLRYLDGRRLTYQSLGPDPAVALVAKRKKEVCLQALADGLTVIEGPSLRPARPQADRQPAKEAKRRIDKAVEDYLNEVSRHKAWSTYRHYATTLRLFQCSCTA